MPVLCALQSHSKSGPPGGFGQYLIPRAAGQPMLQPNPPARLSADKCYNLSAIPTRPGVAAERLTLLRSTPVCRAALEPLLHECTILDVAQAAAVRLALSSELALIQGPPGTGKTFLGVLIAKVLLQNRPQAERGPILTVCYTNHALDQFLEGYASFLFLVVCKSASLLCMRV